MLLRLYPALATWLALLIYLGTVIACARARGRTGIKAPAVAGNAEFERYFRIQQKRLEQLILFLPSLWIFGFAVSPYWAGALGLVFVAGHVLYAASHAGNPAARGPGFAIAFIATALLLQGGLGGLVSGIATGAPA